MVLQLRVASDDVQRAMLDTMARAIREVDENVRVVLLETWRE
jgi:hypothetical protein